MKFFNNITLACLICFAVFYTGDMHAQALKEKTTRILFLVDGSSSMLDAWNPSSSRFDATADLVGQIMDSIIAVNMNVEFGLRVFGHQHIVTKQNCYDTRMEVKFRKLAMEQIKVKLQYTSPMGVSPIAWSLQEAAEMDLVDNNNYAYSIILITDGGESCGGNICEVMEKMVNQKINFQPYIVSMLDYAPLKKEYECMGKYMLVTKPADFQPVIHTIMEDNNYFKATEQTKYVPVVNKTTLAPIFPKIDTVILVTTPKVDAPAKTNLTTEIDKITGGNLSKPRLQYSIVSLTYPKVKIPKLPTFKYVEEVETPVVTTPIYTAITKTGPVEVIRPRLSFSIPVKTQYKTVAVKPLPKFNFIIAPEKPALVAIDRLPASSIQTKWRMPSLYTIPIYKRIAVNKLPKFTFQIEPETPKVVVKPPVKTEIPKIDVSNTEIKITSENKADEVAPGTFQIFFTNGKGKYYKSMPKIVITDLKTKKEVYKGVRKVLAGGVPEELFLPEGKYEVVSVQSGRTATFDVINGKNQKVEIVVGSGSLSFIHPGTKEFAKGYIAMVSKRFEEATPATSHPTELVLTYEASNYHIEVNTLPPLLFNIELEFDFNYQIGIPKTGLVQVLNENDLGRIIFYHESSSNFIPFYEMNVYGDTEYQQIEFLPGLYQVRYFAKDAAGKSTLKVKEFKLESLKKLTLTLE